MEQNHFEVSMNVRDAFIDFASDASLLALPLKYSAGKLDPLPPISYPEHSTANYQVALSQLEAVVNTKTPLYLILRQDHSLIAITYVPHLVPAELKNIYLVNRHELVQNLGGHYFASSLICKEPAEITDLRSWKERDMHGSECKSCPQGETKEEATKDLGYHKNKCRLCDRRMKNNIEETASKALKMVDNGGDCVQLSVDMSNNILKLNLYEQNLSPTGIAAKLPTDHPSFTFYRHLESRLTYFIFCSPDSVPVKERMSHTLAIPGLVNIIAKENGVTVDQKIEIHDPDELEFGEKDTRIGKFRSLYLRNDFVGTESTWEKMEEAQKILDSIR